MMNQVVPCDADALPKALYLWLSPEEAEAFFETKCITWQTPFELNTLGIIKLPKLLTGTFQDLRDIFFHNFMSNPKSREVIAEQDQWRVDIVEEFQKPNAGVFENTIQTMVKTNKSRLEKLKTLRLLRLFKTPYQKEGTSSTTIFLKINPTLIDPDLFSKRTFVTYTDDCPPLLKERVFMRGMFGPKWTPIESLYADLFGVRPTALAFQEESLLFAEASAHQELKMKIPEEALL